MKQNLLAVMPDGLNYLPEYDVSVAKSFEQAKAMLRDMEERGTPFDTLDLPADDEKRLWEFLNWMKTTGRNYPFSVFGCKSDKEFWALCETCRKKGFQFNT